MVTRRTFLTIAGAGLADGTITCLCERGSQSAPEEIGDPKAIPATGEQGEKSRSWKQKEFFITFWGPPPAEDKALAAVAAEHYNLTWVPVAGLDVAARHGLRALLTNDLLNPATLADPAKQQQLDALIQQVKAH